MTNNEPEARQIRMRAVFDRLAAVYDVAGPGCFVHFGQRLVEETGIQPGMSVLDVASGRGAVLFPAAERAGATGPVTGVDFSAEMARATNEEAKRRGIRARVRVMDAENLDFPDRTFDRVLCGFGLMFFPHLDRSLAEFRRVLRPGGRIGVSTWQVSQTEDLTQVLNGLDLGGPGEPAWITDPDELARLLVHAGFVDARVRADATVFRYTSLGEYWENARGTGERRRLDVLDADQTRRVRAALAERVLSHQKADGLYLGATALLAVATR